MVLLHQSLKNERNTFEGSTEKHFNSQVFVYEFQHTGALFPAILVLRCRENPNNNSSKHVDDRWSNFECNLWLDDDLLQSERELSSSSLTSLKVSFLTLCISDSQLGVFRISSRILCVSNSGRNRWEASAADKVKLTTR